MNKFRGTFSSPICAFALLAVFFLIGMEASAQVQPSGFDVKLSKTLLTMPGNGFFVNNDVPLLGARWFGGYFAVSSACSGNNNSKGLWIFREDGALVKSLNTCRDTGENTSGSGAHSWSTIPNVQSVGENQFVKEMGPFNNRPPLLYRISGSNVSLISKPWRSSWGNNDDDQTAVNVAAIPGYAAVLELQTTGSGSRNAEQKNVLYRLPSWSVIDEMDAAFVPITGVGDFILGTPTPGNKDLVLYRVSDNELELIDTLETSIRPIAATIDTASSTRRVGLLFFNAPGASRNSIGIYRVSSEGLALERTVNLPDSVSFSSTGWQGAFAISGEYTAFLDCGLPAVPAPTSGASDNLSARTCGVGVFKGSTRLSVERLPHATTIGNNSRNSPIEIYQPQPDGIAISADGKDLVAVTRYGAYLYEIVGSAGIPPENGTSTTTPFVGVGLGSLNDILAFATSYLNILQTLMGSSAIAPGTSFGETSTTSPAIQGAFDQVLKIINSN